MTNRNYQSFNRNDCYDITWKRFFGSVAVLFFCLLMWSLSAKEDIGVVSGSASRACFACHYQLPAQIILPPVTRDEKERVKAVMKRQPKVIGAHDNGSVIVFDYAPCDDDLEKLARVCYDVHSSVDQTSEIYGGFK